MTNLMWYDISKTDGFYDDHGIKIFTEKNVWCNIIKKTLIYVFGYLQSGQYDKS